MKRTLLFILSVLPLFWYATELFGQTKIMYAYDNAGNRISRLQITTRSFTPIAEKEGSKDNSWEARLSRIQVNIYPNPVQTDLHVSISELPVPGTGFLELYDLQGKLLARESVVSIQTVVPMTDLPSGSYILRLFFAEVQSTWKVIKE